MLTPQQTTELYELAEKAMRPHRDVQKVAVERMAGRHYMAGRGDVRYDNQLLNEYRQLMPRITRAEFYPVVKPKSAIVGSTKLIELAARHIANTSHMAETHAACVGSALLGPFGVARCGFVKGQEQTQSEWSLGIADKYFCEHVSNFDFGIDPTARCIDEADFAYDGYWMDIAKAEASGLFDMNVLRGADRASDASVPNEVGAGGSARGINTKDRVRLVDFYHRDGDGWTVCTHVVSGQQLSKQYARQATPWVGPETGPYNILVFDTLPDQLYGLSMAAQLMDGDDASARMVRHAVQSFLATKRVIVYEPSQEDVVLKIRNAEHLEHIPGNPAAIQAVDYGGVPDALLGGIGAIREIINQRSSINLLSGAKDPGKTATATAYLQSNAQNVIESFQSKSSKFAGDLVRGIVWAILEGGGVRYPFDMEPIDGRQHRVLYDSSGIGAKFSDVLVSVEPFSGLPTDANSKLARFTDLVQMAIPLSMQLAQVGADPRAFLTEVDNIADTDLVSIFDQTSNQQQQQLLAQQVLGAVQEANAMRMGGASTARTGVPSGSDMQQVRSDMQRGKQPVYGGV